MLRRFAGNPFQRVLERPLAVADVDGRALRLDRLEVASVVE